MRRRTGGVLSSATHITTPSAILRLTPSVSRPANSRSSAQPDAAGALGAIDELQLTRVAIALDCPAQAHDQVHHPIEPPEFAALPVERPRIGPRGIEQRVTLSTSSRRMMLMVCRRYA